MGADSIEVDKSSGKMTMMIGDQRFEVDNNGAIISDSDFVIAAGDRASLPEDFPFEIPKSAQIDNITTTQSSGVNGVIVHFLMPDSSLDIEEQRIKQAVTAAGLTPQTTIQTAEGRIGQASSEDGKHNAQYVLGVTPKGVHVQLTHAVRP